tara:strand:- start:94259 stop:95440 length:1182 start_codon:yes stop_codon:yes gene_type:complete
LFRALAISILFTTAAASADEPIPRADDTAACEDNTAHFCRIADGVSLADALEYLSDADTAYWTEGETIVIAARRPAGGEPARLCCALQESLDLLDDGQIWGARFWIADLDQAFIDINVSPRPESADGEPQVLTFRGANSPPPPPQSASLNGTLEDTELVSDALAMTRTLTIYTPPGQPPAQGWPVVYIADGRAVAGLANIADALIMSGEITPVLLVGLWNAPAPPTPPVDFSFSTDSRSQEYLWGVDPDRFQAHQDFLMSEVIPLTVRDYHATQNRDQRMVFGFSSGAAWALTTALLHPDQFGYVTGASFGWQRAMTAAAASAGSPAFYLSGGELEPGFLRDSQNAAETLSAAGAEAHFQRFVSGHTYLAFSRQFATGLMAAFPATPGPASEP